MSIGSTSNTLLGAVWFCPGCWLLAVGAVWLLLLALQAPRLFFIPLCPSPSDARIVCRWRKRKTEGRRAGATTRPGPQQCRRGPPWVNRGEQAASVLLHGGSWYCSPNNRRSASHPRGHRGICPLHLRLSPLSFPPRTYCLSPGDLRPYRCAKALRLASSLAFSALAVGAVLSELSTL